MSPDDANVFHGEDCPYIKRPCPFIEALRESGRKAGEEQKKANHTAPDEKAATAQVVADAAQDTADMAQGLANELGAPLNDSDHRLKKSADAMAEADRKLIQQAIDAPAQTPSL